MRLDQWELENELRKLDDELSTTLGSGRTLRLEARKAQLLRELGRDEEAGVIEDYIKLYNLR